MQKTAEFGTFLSLTQASSKTRSSKNGHNFCVRVSKNIASPVIYRDWSSWLSQYFTACKGISTYQHFRMERKHPSLLFVKERKDSEEIEINLAKEKSGSNFLC